MRYAAQKSSCVGNKEECNRTGAGMCTDNGSYVGDDLHLNPVSLFEHIGKELCIGKAITVRNEYGSVFFIDCLFGILYQSFAQLDLRKFTQSSPESPCLSATGPMREGHDAGVAK